MVAALAAAQAPARISLQTYVCGVGNGSTWTRAGTTGRDWVVIALDDKNQCKSARQWLATLSARLTAHAGADVQAFRLLGDACVLTKSTLLAACRTGNGGPGTVGVAVIGDPAHNPAARPYTGGRTSLPALPASRRRNVRRPRRIRGRHPDSVGRRRRLPLPGHHGRCHLDVPCSPTAS